MASVQDLIDSLADDGFALVEEAGRVRYVAGVDRPLDEDRARFLEERQAELLRHLRLDAARRRLAAAIRPTDRLGRLPLSLQQQRLWLVETFAHGETGAYHIPTLIHLAGKLDPLALSAALNGLVARHEILRTVFSEENGHPFQQVLPAMSVALETVETSPGRLAETVRREAARPFDLTTGPLLRACLFRLAPEQHALLLVQHHLISDGWSIDLLTRELATLYGEGPAALPDPDLQYGDVAVWQRQVVDEELVELELDHWRNTLDGWSPIELPTDHPRRGLPDHHGDHHHFRIAPETVRAVAALARTSSTTPFVVLLAAFQAVLRVHARQDDLTIVTALAGRTHLQLADLPGFFVNLVPLRTRLAASETFHDLLQQVDAALHEGLAHQDVPYERLIKDLDVPREATGRTPLERVVFVLQSANAGPPVTMPGLDVTVTPESDLPVARFELTFSLLPDGDAIAGRIEYGTALYEPSTIRRLADHYLRQLDAAVADPRAPLSAMSLLTGDEFRRFVLDTNRTSTAYPRDAGLIELFEQRVDRAPDSIAIRDGRRSLTYAEIDRAANRLAARLTALGLTGRKMPTVAMRLERSVELVVAMLGILKAGAAYVPVDPAYPLARARYMLQETEAAALVVANAADGAGLLAGELCPLIVLDQLADGSDRRPERIPGPAGLAYVCFTSGTTGTPKGVLVEQRAVVRLVIGSDFIRFDEGARVALASNAVFDAITLEVWGALLNGSTLVVLATDTLLDPDALAAKLAAERIDILWLTTALFDQLAGRRPDMFRHLDYLLVGGGALNPTTIRSVLRCPAGAPRHLVNGYGPTENTTFSTCHLIDTLPDSARSIPIGRPIANSTAYVLDSAGYPLPPGVAGELHVGGDGLARGYLNDPAQTAARFVERTLSHPDVADQVVARLYATGDLVRWRDDGTLEFLGRIDRQLKLNGFRVEPGEVEAAIAAHPAVLQAVVRTIDSEGHPRLCAWYACRPDEQIPAPALRRHLEECLPIYMVPAFLVCLPRLPIKPSGKIDVDALPEPTANEVPQTAGDSGVASSLLAIWRRVLRNDGVGPQDDFFTVGGDSILSIQVVAKAREQGLQLSPRDIFEARTVERLAGRVTPAGPGALGAIALPAGPLPLIPIQHWFFKLGLPEPQHFNQAFLLIPPNPVTAARLEEALQRLVERHDALQMRFEHDGEGSWRPRVTEGRPPMVAAWHMTSAAEADLQEQLTAWQAGFDLHEGALVAAGIVDGHPDGRQRILLAIHHLAVDIVSWRILLDELVRLTDDPTDEPLPAGTSFASWAHALAAFAQGSQALSSLGYWHGALRPGAMLPFDPSDRVLETAAVRLDRETTDGLLQRSAHAYGTRVHELILAALVPALAASMGGRSAALILEGHGREDVVGLDVSSTVGWFTSRFPVRFELPDEADIGAVIVAVKEQLRAVPHNGLSYGVLRELAADPATRAALGAAEPETTFNYLGQLDGIAVAGWTVAPEPPGRMVALTNPPASRLDITALVVDGAFEVRLTVGEPGLPRGWAAKFAGDFIERLRKVVDHCRSRTAARWTPADFPGACLPADELNTLASAQAAPPAAIYRLTPLQEGLLFHALHSPASDQYVVQFDWRCAAAIEPEPLRDAWQALVQAHDVLRTRFAWRGLSHPVQLVDTVSPLAWRFVDLSSIQDHAAQSAAVEAERLTERSARFDLEQTGALRVALLRLGPRSWVMLWTHHHILLDGWCVPLLQDELGRRYEAIRQDRPFMPPPVPSYGHYVAWLRRQDAEAARAFWHERLQGFDLPTDIPIRKPGSMAGSHQPVATLGLHTIQCDTVATRRLEQFVRQEGATLNALVQLAWGCLLAAYAGGSRDVVFGTIVSGRANTFPGIERVIGLVANIVPVRLRLDPAATVATALRDMHAWVEAASEHSHLSLAEIQAVTDVPAETALFSSVTVFENYPSLGASGGPLGAAAPTVHDKTNFPLLVMALPGEALTFTIQYDAALFEPAAISALAGHLTHFVTTLADDPARPLDQLELVSAAERAWLLAHCNATDHPLDPAATAISLLDAQVSRTPDATAVEDDAGRTLTYAVLHAAANRLAHRLRRLHQAHLGRPLAPDTRIGLCLERGHGLIISILAVIKAGGAYVALDPDHPAERLAFMANDSGCALIVSVKGLADRLVAAPDVPLVVLDDGEPDDLPADAPSDVPAPGDLAYVLYTSGSTGRPKGAMIEHRSLVNRILWMQAAYPLGPDDRVLQKTPFSFDVSVWEFFWPLMVGARLVFAQPGGHKDPAYLARLIDDRRITTLHFVPSMLRVFLEVVDIGRLRSVRRIFCSGEALPTELPRQVLGALPTAELHNLYGPTEATVDVSEHACSTNEPGSVVPIGRPIWNTQLHVLDTRMRLLPAGVPGELWIGGVQVGRGYLNRPELTAERFVRNPFGQGHLYRTGDLVRRRADGILDYLGRSDFQVKVRGVRIELAEIEAALEDLPGVRQALVVARPHRGETELVAYLATGTDAPDPAHMRAALARTLPEAMVPARWVRLERLPLNSSGKVDRAALPAPDEESAAAVVPSPTPASALEADLVGIFAEVLGAPIGPNDDFFAHGGHSLLAVRVVARIVQRLRAEVPLAAMFEHRSAAALARVVAAMLDTVSADVPRLDRSQPLPASFAQERLWFLDRVIADRAAYHVPLALRIGGRIEIGALTEALDGLAASHEILRTRLVSDDGRLWQEIDSAGSVPLSLETVPPARLDERLSALARQPFDLEAGPPIRAHLLRLGPAQHVLLLNQHHAITDGWSLALLLRELGARYRAAAQGVAPDLPPVAPAQYADLAAWERQQLSPAREVALLAFWREQLRQAPPLDLPLDTARPPVMSHRGAVVQDVIPAEVAQALQQVAAGSGATSFAVLLAAFGLLLSRWTGSTDLVVATPVANRSHPAQMEALGLFVNTVALRMRLARQEEPFTSLVADVAHHATAAFAHHELPFDRLLEGLALPRDPSRPPLTPVMFILQNAGELDGFDAPRLSVERLPVDTSTAKFDLTLSIEPQAAGLAATFEYAADLFQPATIEALATAYGKLLGALAAEPAISIGSLASRTGLATKPAAPPREIIVPPIERPAWRAANAPSDLRALTAAIWCEVLGRDSVGEDQNFFDLGGTSLGLMRVQARLERELGREVPVLELFSHPTVARLAAWLEGGGGEVETILPQPRPSRRGQRRNWAGP